MAYEQAYVFAADPLGQQQLVGELDVAKGRGSFQYSEYWLAAPWAYPIDPINLALSGKRYRTLNKHGLFGVFRDAAPDDWGTRIMLLLHQHAPANELERLIRTSGGGVGCVRFSLSRQRTKEPATPPSMARLLELAHAAEKLETKQSLAPEELALLEPGSSMGGARPKVTVVEGSDRWLVKFSKAGDFVNIPQLEYCSMQFLKQFLDLNVPQSRLIELGAKQAFAVQRFDYSAAIPKHFISANSLFNQDRIRLIEDSKRNPYSYCNLASVIRKHCADYANDGRELFTRMLANIVMGNTDDHARNHALIYNIAQAQWQLSPAYDMLPVVGSQTGRQSMGVGRYGAKSTIDNALSYAKLFGLNDADANRIATRVSEAYRQWPEFCLQQGMVESDVKLIKRVMLAP